MSVEVRDARGRRVWTDPRKGAYLRPPAVDTVGGLPAVVSDDHGELRRYGATGAIAWLADWTAAYTLPIVGPFGAGGSWAILRAGGIHGLELLDERGLTIWRTDAELWEYASSTPAVGFPGTDREPVLGAVARGGAFRAIDVRTGSLRWELDLGSAPNASSIVAADLDGDGRDEFLVGLPNGRLVCLGEEAPGTGNIDWTATFDSAVANPIVVDLDGDGVAELVVATADGQVRWLVST
jgi:outer membrane protein assembly factor BamB